MGVSQYPVEAAGGPFINRIIAFPKEFPEDRYQYEDGGCDVNVQPCGLLRWLLQYEGLSQAQLDTIITHFNSAQVPITTFSLNTFNFANPQDSTTYTGVRYERIEIARHKKKWALPVNVYLFCFR